MDPSGLNFSVSAEEGILLRSKKEGKEPEWVQPTRSIFSPPSCQTPTISSRLHLSAVNGAGDNSGTEPSRA